MVIDNEVLDFKFRPRGVNCGREGLWRERTLCQTNLCNTQDLLDPELILLTLRNRKGKSRTQGGDLALGTPAITVIEKFKIHSFGNLLPKYRRSEG